jgi:hypothetical protein
MLGVIVQAVVLRLGEARRKLSLRSRMIVECG